MRRALLAYSDSSWARMPATGSLKGSAMPALVIPMPSRAAKTQNRQTALENRLSIRALPILRNRVALHFVDQSLAAETEVPRSLQLVVARSCERLRDHAALQVFDRFLHGGLRRGCRAGFI